MGRPPQKAILARQLAEGINPRDETIASELVDGKTEVDACIAAGYPKTKAQASAYKIAKRPGVRAALMRIADELTNKQIGAIGKGKLIQMLEDPNAEDRVIVQAIRMALEVGGDVGAAREVVMRHEIHVPPAAREMIARRIMELQQKEAIDAVTEGHALPLQEGN